MNQRNQALADRLQAARRQSPSARAPAPGARKQTFMTAEEAAPLLSAEATRLAKKPVSVSANILRKMEQGRANIPEIVAIAAERVYKDGTGKILNPAVPLSTDAAAAVAFGRDLAGRHMSRCSVLLGAAARPWSMKLKGCDQLEILAPIGVNRHCVMVGLEGIGKIPPRTLIIFAPDPFPHDGVWLLLQKKADHDVYAIRYTDEDHHGYFIGPDRADEPLPAEEWDVLGFALALAPPVGLTYPNYEIKMGGIRAA